MLSVEERVWCGLLHVPSNVDRLIIRVFATPGASQYGPFGTGLVRAKEETNLNFDVDYMSVGRLKTNRDGEDGSTKYYTPSDLVDWLLESHLHFFVTHPNQGQRFWAESLRWDFDDLQNQLARLEFHRGFPNGRKIFCPMFTQNKFEYLRVLPDITNPTIQILLSDYLAERFHEQVRIFCDTNNYGAGFVVKAPYTTTKEYVKMCDDYEEVVAKIIAGFSKFDNVMPYLMVQTQMANQKEMKIVCLDGKAHCVAYNCSNSKGGAISKAPYDDVFAFAEFAVAELHQRNSCAITDSLVRVDIFRNVFGKLVVNEFESMEAAYETNGRRADTLNNFTGEFLSQYWTRIIIECCAPYIKN